MDINGVWVPLTPAKPIPARSSHYNQTSSISNQGTEQENTNNEFPYTQINLNQGTFSKSPTTVQDDTSGIQDVGNDSVPSQSETKEGKKRRYTGIDLNKKPSKKPKTKKHRPKVYDDSKPKKVPKVKTPKTPKTPKPETPNLKERRARSRKEKLTEPTTYLQNSNLEDIEITSQASIVPVGQCKRTLFVDQDSNNVPKSNEETKSCTLLLDLNQPTEREFDHVTESHDKHKGFNFEGIVTSKRNTPRRSRFQNKSLEDSMDFLGGNNQDPNGLDISVIKNLEQSKKHVKRFVNVYRCQKKKRTGYASILQVYKRTFRVDHCLQSSRKSGPNFRKMFKKQRTMRKKVTINVKGNLGLKFLENGKKKNGSNRKHAQNTKSKNKKEVVKSLIPVNAPMKRKRSSLHIRVNKNLVDLPDSKEKSNDKNLVDFPDSKEKSNDDEGVLLCQEENFLQFSERFPLLEQDFLEITEPVPQQQENFLQITESAPLQENTFLQYTQHVPLQEETFLEVTEPVPPQKEKFLQITKSAPLQEEDFLEYTENVPLYEAPVLEITTLPLHVQGVDNSNSFGALEWLQSLEAPGLSSQSMIPKQIDSELYIEEMAKFLANWLSKLDIDVHGKELVVRNEIDINAPGNKLVVQNEAHGKELMVLNNASGAIVKAKKKKEKKEKDKEKPKLQGKVDLDEESMRVWEIVMANNGSQPFEELDGDKAEWWEKERDMFRGRVDSFIAKMHLIQGNRTFTPWKGSVVDSVVGVFLTQNVTDNLSSSAFMHLAARFPAKSKSIEVVDHDEVNTSQESVKSNTLIDEVNASQESVVSNTLMDEVFFNNDNMDQNMSTPCADVSELTQTTQLSQTQPSNLLHNENPQSFRSLLELEEVDYLKNFYYVDDESLVQEKSTHVEKKSTLLEHKSTLDEQKSSLEEESRIVDPVCSLESKEKSTLVGQKSNLEKEKSTLVEEKSTVEEESRIVDPICSLESQITMEQEVNIVDTQESNNNNKGKNKKTKKEKKPEVKIDWEKFRQQYSQNGEKERNENHMDAVDWEAVWRAPVQQLANLIVERGMNNVLAKKIKLFLDRMKKDHGSIDLEWLRDVPPDKVKEYLLSIYGIGLKSVECVRLLTLHHNAFPVDTNVGRVATRLGWVPLQPLPEQVQIHLLNDYPMVDTIQKYLYPRLCTLDQKTLYELHYQLITFGKVFCTKLNPNCNACPMRAECRHYASAYASARLALPGPPGSSGSGTTTIIPAPPQQPQPLPPLADVDLNSDWSNYVQNCDPIIEVPPSPEPYVTPELPDIEDLFLESDDEIPIIRLNTDEFEDTLKETINKKNNIVVPDMSKAIVALSARAASFRVLRPIKKSYHIRTIHNVYELPDDHPILVGFEEREQEDPSRYLLAIWPTEKNECGSCNDTQEETVKGTILIPCRTANRGKFPLNGTYFQVNEVFADDETSEVPMDVPRSLLWNLPRRDLGCGTSATSIFKGLSTSDIQHLFWRGSICVRNFNRKTRRPSTIHKRLHDPDAPTSAAKKKMGKK